MIEIQEHKSEKYPPRTYFNATSADVTLALAVDLTTAGEKLTHKAAGEKYIGFEINKESDPIEIARKLYKFMKQKNAKTLNIAGNGIYTLVKHGFDQNEINIFVLKIIEKIHEHIGVDKIYTGGQTGVDLSGAVAAKVLGINALITLPNGYIQRFENNIDIKQKKEDVELQIESWSNKLIDKNKMRM